MWDRIKKSLVKTSSHIVQRLSNVFRSPSLSPEQLEEIGDALLMADVGVGTVEQLLRGLRCGSGEEARSQLVRNIAALIRPYEKLLEPKPIVLVVGVNGSGKTTMLGKLAWAWRGKKIRVVAADTFRAAALEQLEAWTKGCKMTTGGKDPGSVVFRGLTQGREEGDEIILIDTAGRLPNKKGLMDELTKIYSIIERLRPQEPVEVILILDANMGQHGLLQVDLFRRSLPITGVILTKMEGTAKGGILINVTMTYGLPIYGIGLGEGPEDWEPFCSQSYAEGLVGL